MLKVTESVVNYISKPMENWKVELTTRGQSLTEVQRDIFQGDSLSLLQFILVMIVLNYLKKMQWKLQIYKISRKDKPSHVYGWLKIFIKEKELESLVGNYTEMEFGIERRNKKTPNQESIKTLGEKECNKFLGILEADTIKQT